MNYLMLVAMCSSLAADPTDVAQADMEKMQGQWDAVLIERDAKPVPKSDVSNYSLEVKGNKRVLKVAGTVVTESTITIDASKTPKQIDIAITKGAQQGKTLRGI